MSLAGTFAALRSWVFERGPLRAMIVKWSLLALGIWATVAVWSDQCFAEPGAASVGHDEHHVR